MAHISYYLDLCVDTFVVNEGAVLLRLHEKYNFWGVPGGHVELGEDVNQAALREVLEESGLKVELVGPRGWVKKDHEANLDLVPPIFLNRHHINDTHDHSSFIFVARSYSRAVQPQAKEDEKAEYRWCTKEELDQLLQSDERMHADMYRYALAALELIRES